jgi:hypothetical protein
MHEPPTIGPGQTPNFGQEQPLKTGSLISVENILAGLSGLAFFFGPARALEVAIQLARLAVPVTVGEALSFKGAEKIHGVEGKIDAVTELVTGLPPNPKPESQLFTKYPTLGSLFIENLFEPLTSPTQGDAPPLDIFGSDNSLEAQRLLAKSGGTASSHRIPLTPENLSNIPIQFVEKIEQILLNKAQLTLPQMQALTNVRRNLQARRAAIRAAIFDDQGITGRLFNPRPDRGDP